MQYDVEFQRRQAAKYRERDRNHWGLRIDLAHRLVERYVTPRVGARAPAETTVVDVGCSIGTFAIEFAKRGYRAIGVDAEPASLEVARELCREEGVEAEFFCQDIADWDRDLGSIDIAICFDIFEHLHDDQLGSFLSSIRRHLPETGSLVFHTFPTEFDYVFFERPYLRWPLLPFRFLRPERFTALVRAYAAFLDLWLLLGTGKTHRDRIRDRGHCNPTTKERLRDILHRAGYEILALETDQLYPIGEKIQRQFRRQPVSHRNLYGVAIPGRRSALPLENAPDGVSENVVDEDRAVQEQR